MSGAYVVRGLVRGLVRRLVLGPLLGLVLGLVLVPALAAGAAGLTLAVADTPAFSPVLVAEAEGYFAAEGLPLRVLHAVNGRRCLKHLLDGEAQFATVADTPIVMASFTRHDFAVVATFTTSAREYRFLARADRGIRKPADLNGKRIGVVMGTSSQYFADSFLLFHGITPSQVSLVALDAADPGALLVGGDVDAAALYNPAGHLALDKLGANAVLLPSPKLVTITYNLVSVAPQAGGRDEDVAKLLRALHRAETLIAKDPARARADVTRSLKLDPKDIDTQWSDYDFDLELGQSLVTALEAQARWAQRNGLAAGHGMPDYLDFIRTEPLRQVAPAAVSLIK